MRLWREFRRGFHHYTSSPPPTEFPLEWASIMQHHGAPTRLLDFSYSIYVAAYFAFERSVGKYAAVWSIDARWDSRLGRCAARYRKDSRRHAWNTDESDEATISSLVFGGPDPFCVAAHSVPTE